ncbi:P12 structural protein [Lissonota sp. PSUC_FEM 10030012]|nr:P12 structural protein [Lissonota sp. PSUC_FEM 10030012]
MSFGLAVLTAYRVSAIDEDPPKFDWSPVLEENIRLAKIVSLASATSSTIESIMRVYSLVQAMKEAEEEDNESTEIMNPNVI